MTTKPTCSKCKTGQIYFGSKEVKKMDGYDLGMIVVIVLGVGAIGYIIGGEMNGDVEDLGKSICEEEYGMDFESYNDKVLRCKPFTESYDGIKVEVPKAQTTP